jgi:hypothetical protein
MLNKNIWIFKDIFLQFEFEVWVESNIYIIYNYELLRKFVFVFTFYLWKWYFDDVNFDLKYTQGLRGRGYTFSTKQ